MHQRNSDAADYPALARGLLSRGYTTSRLAQELGVSQPAVSRLANGKQRALGADAALRLIVLAGGSVSMPPSEAHAVAAPAPAPANA